MEITRKAYFEVWPQGASARVSRHTQEREAIESALSQPEGTHEIRVGDAVYLTVTVSGNDTPQVADFVYTYTDDFSNAQPLDGATVDGEIWVWYANTAHRAFYLDDWPVANYQPVPIWSGELSNGAHTFSDGVNEARFVVDATVTSRQAGSISFVGASYSAEAGGQISALVSRTGGEGVVSVDWATSGLTNNASGSLTWADGDTTNKVITFGVGAVSGPEAGNITLSNARKIPADRLSQPVLGSIQIASVSVTVPSAPQVTWPIPVPLPAGTSHNITQYIINPEGETILGTRVEASGVELPASGDGSYNPVTGVIDYLDSAAVGNLVGYVNVLEAGSANVSNATELRNAVNGASSGDTIVCAPGTYSLTLGMTVSAANVTVESSTGNPDDVIIEGDAMLPTSFGHDPSQLPPGYSGPYASVGNIFDVQADGFTLRNVTLRKAGFHAIQIRGENAGGVNDGLIEGVKFRDFYEQFIKVSGTLGNTSGVSNPGARNWIVRNCDFRFESTILSSYNGGIDAHLSQGWLVEGNVFVGFQAPSPAVDYAQGIFQGIMEHAVHMWDGSSGNTVQNNYAINCDRGFGYWDPGEETSNNLYQNLVFHNTTGNYGAIGFEIRRGLSTNVANNVCIMEGGNNFAGIDLRFEQTTPPQTDVRNNVSNLPINLRDGATPNLANNTTNADSGWFVDLANLNARINPSSSAALSALVDTGAPLGALTVDAYGNARPQGAAIDRGMHEYA